MSEALKNKLSEYEVPPPAGNWDRIASALDEGMLTLPGKLYKYEAQPPAHIWSRILIYLDNSLPEDAKVIPLFRKYKKAIQYTAAVAAVLAIVFLSWPLIYNNNAEQDIPFHQNISSTPLSKQNEKDEIIKGNENNLPSYNQPFEKQSNSITRSRKQPVIQSTPAIEELQTIAMLEYIPPATINNDLVTLDVPQDNYMIYTDHDGNAMKLPKKLFDAFDCATKEITCRQKIKDLQQRFASSAVSADFTGVLEILRSLQENQ